MQWLARRRYPVWMCFLLGVLVAGGIAYFAAEDAKSFGEAFGYAFIPALAGGALAAFLGFRHNSKLRG